MAQIDVRQLKEMSEMSPARLKQYVSELYSEERSPIVFGYARVSTHSQERDGYSIESQIEQLKAAGAEQIFTEAYTGTTSDRPEFKKMLSILRTGDSVIVTKLDRLARNAVDGEKIVEELMQNGITLKILNMGTIDDSPIGKVTRQIFFAFAEFERNIIIERTREGKERAKLNPNFREGRPHKFNKAQLDHAMELLQDHSYTQVAEMTGISRATLSREKKNRMLR